MASVHNNKFCHSWLVKTINSYSGGGGVIRFSLKPIESSSVSKPTSFYTNQALKPLPTMYSEMILWKQSFDVWSELRCRFVVLVRKHWASWVCAKLGLLHDLRIPFDIPCVTVTPYISELFKWAWPLSGLAASFRNTSTNFIRPVTKITL